MCRFPGRSYVLAACAGALLLLAGFAIGCGSGDDEPSQPAGMAGSAAGGSDPAETRPDPTRPTREGGNGKAAPNRSVEKAEKSRRKADAQPQRTSQGRGKDDAGPRPAASATARADADSCVERFDRQTCAAMAKPAGTESQSVEEPADCVRAMSKSECEALAAAQASDRRDDESVNVEKCIENPTPHCEEVLRPLLEAQGAESRGAGQ